jgi:PAS domain S-box-containing protein
VWLNPEDRSRFLQILEDRGVVRGYECQLKRKDGTVIWVSMSGRQVCGADEKMIYSDGFIEDITERKRTEEAIRESEEGHRSIVQTAMDGFWLTNAEGRLLEVNDTYCRMSGYSAEELLTMCIADLVDNQTADETATRIKKLMSQGEARLESRHRRKDGSTFEVEASVQYRPVEGGRFVCFLRDITERKRAEETLRESREQLRLFVEHTPAPSAMFDRQMRYLAYNQRWTSDYGLGEQDLIGRSHYDVFPEIPERWRDIHQRCLLGAVEKCDEDPFPRADGTLDWVRWEIHPWRNGKGEIGGIIIFSEKITDRKRTEAELMQAQKMESVGRLAGGVAHDFNNLLTVINGYSDFLLSGLDVGDPLRSYAEQIRTAGERAAGLTKQLLAFSRKQLIEPKVIDLNTTIQQSAPMLQRLIGEDIDLETYLDKSLGQVLADPDQIHQVIMNLAVNARDAMPDGGTLDIETTNVALDQGNTATMHHAVTPGRYVLMSVTDTGHGMDEKTRQQVFEPFFTTKELGKGTGLGLSTVYGIIRQNGGWIEVQSEVGVGTSFKVYLPRIDACPVQEANVISTATEKGSETILLVEDQEAVRSFAVAALQQCGYGIIEASDGEEAIVAAGKCSGEIHLLLTDVVLPGMNGHELSEVLKAFRPNLKVLFTSGYTADVIGDRGVLGPDMALLRKPFSPDELAAKVREVLAAPLKPTVGS